jgi:low temperature requirement protein LtrA
VSTDHAETERRATPLELFFDLVFVFAFTQVTTLMSDDATWGGLSRGVLILALLWWAWESYAWFTNTVDPDEGAVRGAILVAMAAMFVAALAVPDAFSRHAGVFALGLVVVLLMHVTLYALSAKGDRDLLSAVLRLAPGFFVSSALLTGGAFADGGLRSLLWFGALVAGFLAPVLAGTTGWRVYPVHFAERHELIVIIALGESLVAIGLGARGTGLTASVILAAVLGLVVATAFWLAYFDFFSIRGPQLLASRAGAERAALARDIYAYLHLPMIVGIVLFAVAMKKTLSHVGDELAAIPAVALCVGSFLYLAAFSAMRVRIERKLSRGRSAAAIAFLLLLPVALAVPALAALALVTAVWAGLHAYELIWWREARAQTRALRAPAAAS